MDRGSAGLSVVLLTPVVLALLAFAVLAGRVGTAHQDIVSAAHAAARAASLRHGPEALADARQAAEATLRDAGLECASTQIRTAIGPQAATVTVACAVKVRDLVDLALPGQTTIAAAASAPIDTYRGGP